MTAEQLHCLVCDLVPSDCDVQVDWSTRRSAGRLGHRTTRSVDVTVVSCGLLRLVASGETCEAAWASFQAAWETAVISGNRIDPVRLECCR